MCYVHDPHATGDNTDWISDRQDTRKQHVNVLPDSITRTGRSCF